MFGRQKLAVIVAEFFGAALLTLTILAVSKSSVGFALFVAAAAGFTYLMQAVLFQNVSGAHANPAVTFGLWTLRRISTVKAIIYMAAQVLGAFLAAELFTYLTKQPLANIAGKGFDWRVMIAETLGTFVFTFGVASAFTKVLTGARAAAIMGGSLFLGILLATVISNGLINPAIALGLHSISVTYIVGPLVGAVLGMNLHRYLFAPSEVGLKVTVPKTKRR